MEHIVGIIDKENNPFICDSWIEQGYSCTPHRQRQLKKLIGLTEDKIKSRPRNEAAYVAFVAIRWRIAEMVNDKLESI